MLGAQQGDFTKGPYVSESAGGSMAKGKYFMNMRLNETGSVQQPQKRSSFGDLVPEIAGRQQTDIPQKLKKSKYPTSFLPLSTRGWFYPVGHPLSSGEIEVNQLTAAEEDLMADANLIKNG